GSRETTMNLPILMDTIVFGNEKRHGDGRTELIDTTRIEGSPLYNKDLAPVPVSRRNWTTYNYAALWISMAHCIPTYLLASGLVPDGRPHELAAGPFHPPSRNHDLAHPDPPELASRHALWHPFPGVRAGLLRNDRLEPARADACGRRLRMVRHPGLAGRRGSPAFFHHPYAWRASMAPAVAGRPSGDR